METVPPKSAAGEFRSPDGASHRTGFLCALVTTVIDQHHAYLKCELPAIEALLKEAARNEAEDSRRIAATVLPLFLRFRRELEAHMKREETTLFPLIERLEIAIAQGRPAPRNSFGPLSNAIAFMNEDHFFEDKLLQRMEEISHGFSAPPHAAFWYREAMSHLRTLSIDMVEHIRKEDEELFPKAIHFEESGQRKD